MNIVFTGAVVGSPAYAPRTSGPALPLAARTRRPRRQRRPQAGTYLPPTTAPRRRTDRRPTARRSRRRDSHSHADRAGGRRRPPTATLSIPADFGANGSLVDLWDSGWPTGRYYWTVVPVREVVDGSAVIYVDAEVPQDACAAGRVTEFGKASQPATASQMRPYASGLSPIGQLVAAADRRSPPSTARR